MAGQGDVGNKGEGAREKMLMFFIDLKRGKLTKILKKITSNLKTKLQVFSSRVSGEVCW